MELSLELHNLAPEPAEAWQRMLRFVGWDEQTYLAASRSVEVLLRRASDIVVQTYDYLRHIPETAAILGWEHRIDEAHLEERRRFFTIWLSRTLGLDTSEEFARYLFRAGKYHAGHGPRRIYTPPDYVIGSIGLILASFASAMGEARLPANVIAEAMAAWSKYLSVQQNQMLLGQQAASELIKGSIVVRCTTFGRLRPIIGRTEFEVYAEMGAHVSDVLRKIFNYYPQVRAEALDRVWYSEERSASLWTETIPVYLPRPGWRVLLNGRDLRYAGGFDVPVQAGDVIALFPPGR